MFREAARLQDHELQHDRSPMKRTIIAAAWIAGTTVPVVAAVVFVFGCCVLPFHGYIHKAMPLCHLAMDVIGGHHDGAQTPLPARAKQEPVKRIATEVPRSFQLAALALVFRTAAPARTSAYRSFISLGALRCDQDVGLYALTATLLI
jgi:hypothetical protein